eukprot:8488649-Lingulodinium_polyedra.AAC.1
MPDDARHRIVLICGLPEETDADVATVQIARYGWLDFIAFERGTATALVELRLLRVFACFKTVEGRLTRRGP